MANEGHFGTPGHPSSALYVLRSFEEVAGRLLPEARSGSTSMNRWPVAAPPGAPNNEIDELRKLGVRVEQRP